LWQLAVRVRPGAPSPYIVGCFAKVGEERPGLGSDLDADDFATGDGHALHDVPDDALLVRRARAFDDVGEGQQGRCGAVERDHVGVRR
jgi:hypothetical protein